MRTCDFHTRFLFFFFFKSAELCRELIPNGCAQLIFHTLISSLPSALCSRRLVDFTILNLFWQFAVSLESEKLFRTSNLIRLTVLKSNFLALYVSNHGDHLHEGTVFNIFLKGEMFIKPRIYLPKGVINNLVMYRHFKSSA